MTPSNPESRPGLDDHVVHICEMGCTHVYLVIEHLENGDRNGPLTGIPDEYHEPLLRELKAIMSIYESRYD